MTILFCGNQASLRNRGSLGGVQSFDSADREGQLSGFIEPTSLSQRDVLKLLERDLRDSEKICLLSPHFHTRRFRLLIASMDRHAYV